MTSRLPAPSHSFPIAHPIARTKVLLKARPLAAQLADRLAAPVPDGMELYIHEADVAEPSWLDTLGARFAALILPQDFTWIVEGPVWALDGELFGLCRNNEIDRELTRRLVQLAVRIGAVAVNVHCVDGSLDPAVLAPSRRQESLQRAAPFLQWYVRLCLDVGLVPLIENVPPICRMRRAAFVYTPIGVEPQDLLDCVAAAPGLRLTLDTSHAQLAVNAFRGATTNADGSPPPAELNAAIAFYGARDGPQTLRDYVEVVRTSVESVHVSNAAGVLDEGLPYEVGDADLDAAVGQLRNDARYFVTEPLDSDENHAVLKRSMQTRLESVLDHRTPHDRT